MSRIRLLVGLALFTLAGYLWGREDRFSRARWGVSDVCPMCGHDLPDDWQMAVCSVLCADAWDDYAKRSPTDPTRPG